MPWWTKRASSAPTMLGEVGQEGDHVVLGHRLDLVDAGDVEGHVLAPARRLRRSPWGSRRVRPCASQAWASISNQMRNLVSGDQMATISGRE